jgi:hypothetical protein
MTNKFWRIVLWVAGFAIVFAILLLAFVVLSEAQTVGPVNLTSTQCASISADQKSTVFLQVTGTWTGTLSPKASIGGRPSFAIQVTPAASSTPQSSITADGGYYARVAGYTFFQVCGNTVATGTARIYLNASPASH